MTDADMAQVNMQNNPPTKSGKVIPNKYRLNELDKMDFLERIMASNSIPQNNATNALIVANTINCIYKIFSLDGMTRLKSNLVEFDDMS